MTFFILLEASHNHPCFPHRVTELPHSLAPFLTQHRSSPFGGGRIIGVGIKIRRSDPSLARLVCRRRRHHGVLPRRRRHRRCRHRRRTFGGELEEVLSWGITESVVGGNPAGGRPRRVGGGFDRRPSIGDDRLPAAERLRLRLGRRRSRPRPRIRRG